MLLKTEAIVLRTIKYRETSIISDVLSREKGHITLIANGVRKQRSKMPASLFQPPNLINLVIYYKESSNMHRIKEAQTAAPLLKIFEKIKRIAAAQFVTELIKKTVRESSPNESLYQFVRSKLLDLEEREKVSPIWPIHFMLQLSKYLGFAPDFNAPGGKYLDLREGKVIESPPPHPHFLSTEKTSILKSLLKADETSLKTIEIPLEKRREILRDLSNYYLIHVDGMKPLKSAEIFASVFKE